MPKNLVFKSADAPKAQKRPHHSVHHGISLDDEYHWLRAENWQAVLRQPEVLPKEIRSLIEAENSHADAVLAESRALQSALIVEMRDRMDPDEADVPLPDGPYAYYSRFRKDGQHPLFCRAAREGGAEKILLDGDALADGKAFFDLGDCIHSPDHRLLAWSVDEQGSEFYALRIRDVSTGQDLADFIVDTDGHVVWGADSRSFFYVRMDENHRPMSVWRHVLGGDAAEDRCLYEEKDPAWFITIHAALDGRHCVLTIKDHDSSECHLIDLTDENSTPILVQARRSGIRYSIIPHGDDLYALTNEDGAVDFKVTQRQKDGRWRDVIPHRPGCLIVSFMALATHFVRLERENCLPQIVFWRAGTGFERKIAFDEPAYALSLHDLYEFDSPFLRFSYSSMTTPEETYDYDLATGERHLRKRQSVPSGHDPALYVAQRLFAKSHDGAEVPITLLYRRDITLPAPTLLYGYGAYGHALSASFSSNRLSLVDRGFVFAIAHVRGGMEKGFAWYEKGKLEFKTNSFKDFIACAGHLIAQGFSVKGGIVAQGGSAGGMLMGAVANMAPELFGGIIADVPFVDVLNTMLDDTLPLTPPEWLEWGNPITDKTAFERMRAYAPYEAVSAQTYPPILALAGLTDPRVTYWEPLKWVARLRERMRGGGPILLKTNMDAGHGGASGRFDQLEEVALCQAFALTCCAKVTGP